MGISVKYSMFSYNIFAKYKKWIFNLPPVPSTFNRSKSFMVTCNDFVGDGFEGTTTFWFVVTSFTFELATWFVDDDSIGFEVMAAPL